MKLSLKAGTTSKLLDLFVQDSSSTTGAGLTGLAYNTGGLTAYYYREGAASALAITLATMTLGTWATGGFVAIDGANMPGAYQLSIPDAVLASGAKSVIVMLKGATNMAPAVLEIELTAVDNQSATAFMTSVATVINLTNAPTSGDLTATMKTSVQTVVDAAVTANTLVNSSFATVNSTLSTISGFIDTEVSAIKTKTDQLIFTTANRVDCQVYGMQANTLNASALATDAVSEIQSGLSTLDAAGVRGAVGLASANLDAQLSTIGGYIDTEIATILARLGTPAGASIAADIANKTGYSLTTAYDFAKGTVAMTEAYAVNGVAPTPAQAMFAIHQMLMQFSISGTNYTVKKLDNATTAFVVTLNDATNPTSAVRT